MVCPSSARTQIQLHPTDTVTATPRACPSRDQGSRDRPGHVTPRVSSAGWSGGPGQPAFPRGLPFAGWNLPLLCAALGPASEAGKGAALWKFTIGAQGPHVFREGGWKPQPVCPLLWKHNGSRLGLSRPHPAAGGAPQAHPALRGRQHWVRCLSFSRSRD